MQKNLNSFVWSDPVLLVQVSQDKDYVKLTLEGGKQVKMSKKKYFGLADQVTAEATTLKGKVISYRTSQNTKQWADSIWFSGVKEVSQ